MGRNKRDIPHHESSRESKIVTYYNIHETIYQEVMKFITNVYNKAISVYRVPNEYISIMDQETFDIFFELGKSIVSCGLSSFDIVDSIVAIRTGNTSNPETETVQLISGGEEQHLITFPEMYLEVDPNVLYINNELHTGLIPDQFIKVTHDISKDGTGLDEKRWCALNMRFVFVQRNVNDFPQMFSKLQTFWELFLFPALYNHYNYEQKMWLLGNDNIITRSNGTLDKSNVGIFNIRISYYELRNIRTGTSITDINVSNQTHIGSGSGMLGNQLNIKSLR